MQDERKEIRRLERQTKNRPQTSSNRVPKRLFLGVRLKGSPRMLCPVLRTEGKP
jgi:hypothetical protein